MALARKKLQIWIQRLKDKKDTKIQTAYVGILVKMLVLNGFETASNGQHFETPSNGQHFETGSYGKHFQIASNGQHFETASNEQHAGEKSQMPQMGNSTL